MLLLEEIFVLQWRKRLLDGGGIATPINSSDVQHFLSFLRVKNFWFGVGKARYLLFKSLHKVFCSTIMFFHLTNQCSGKKQ